MLIARLYLTAALCAASLIATAPAVAATSDCPEFPQTAVVVHPIFDAPRYNFQQSLARLRQIAETQSAAIFHRDQPVGLALGELTVTMGMQANAVLRPDKGDGKMVCAKPASLNVDVGFQNSTVYVARELPRRTCAHNEILEHEEKHVEIDRQLLKEYMPIIQAYLETSVRELGTVRAKDTAAAEEKMQSFISKQLEKVSQKMNAERARRQAAHDSQEEYQRLAVVCNGDVTTAVNVNSPAADREYQRAQRKNMRDASNGAYRNNVTRAPTSRAATQRRWESQKQQVAPSSQQKAADFKGEAPVVIDQ